MADMEDTPLHQRPPGWEQVHIAPSVLLSAKPVCSFRGLALWPLSAVFAMKF